ncbi:MAG: energy-coupling factor transporter transmembrane protein EcfT [Clostridia bacterium]|nr:energy-coupling factor transporter transmembrane protein EcfT [Clostridia bacterium]
MIRDITLGQYYDCESPIHKMDPRTKILWTLFYMITLFLIDGLLPFVSVILFTAVIIKVSNIPIRFMLRGLKPILLLVVFTALLNLFLTPGETVVFSKGIFTVTLEGIYMAVKMAVRISLLIIGSSILTLTTTPTVLTGGLEILLSPLKKIGIPISVFVMMISIALRFIPTLLDETEKIIKAQTSRGADFEHGNPIKRIKAMIPILIPLFVSAFRRADELAVAMECRCYNCDAPRTSYRRFTYKKYDMYALFYGVLMIAILIVLKVVL